MNKRDYWLDEKSLVDRPAIPQLQHKPDTFIPVASYRLTVGMLVALTFGVSLMIASLTWLLISLI